MNVKNFEDNFIDQYSNIIRYPYIILPKQVENVFIYKKFPEIKYPIAPVKPKISALSDNNYYLILVVTIIVAILIGIQNPNLIIPFSILTGIIFFVVIKLDNNQTADNNQIKKDYDLQLQKYEAQLIEHDKKIKLLSKSQLEQQILLSNEEKKFDYIKNILSNYEKPVDIELLENNKTGITENHFLKFAFKHFNDKVCIKKKIKCKYFLDKPYANSYMTEFFNDVEYYPDIAIIDKVLGIAIDIEIDEPYDMINKEPTHFISKVNANEKRFKNRNTFAVNQNHKSSDDFRDECITDCNWVVIRFSEEQVVEYPENCCYFIAKVINQITNTFSYDLDKFSYYITEREEIPDTRFYYNYRRWDYEYSKKYMVPACRREIMLMQQGIVPKLTFILQGWLNSRQLESINQNFNL